MSPIDPARRELQKAIGEIEIDDFLFFYDFGCFLRFGVVLKALGSRKEHGKSRRRQCPLGGSALYGGRALEGGRPFRGGEPFRGESPLGGTAL